MRKKPLSPDDIVERALKRLPKVAPEVLDEDFEPRTSVTANYVPGYNHQIRVGLHQSKVWKFWRYELRQHLLVSSGGLSGKLNDCAREGHWKWSRPFFSEAACVKAAHQRMDEIDAEVEAEPEKIPLKILGGPGQGASYVEQKR